MTTDIQEVSISIKSDSNDNNEETTFIKTRNFAADTFTPVKIKDLSFDGRKNMGYFGIPALIVLFIILAIDLYALLDESPIVIVNVMIPIAVSLLSLEKLIALVLHIVLKQFK